MHLVLSIFAVTLLFLNIPFSFAQQKSPPQEKEKQSEMRRSSFTAASTSYKDIYVEALENKFSAGFGGPLLFDGESTDLTFSAKRQDNKLSDQAKTDGFDSIDAIVYSGSFGVAQSMGTEHLILLNLDQSKSESTTATGYTLGYQIWVMPSFFRLGLGLRRYDSDADVLPYTDVDGKRVELPEKIQGDSGSVDLLCYATTRTILIAGYNATQRSDRPLAWSANAEIRQYIDPLYGALHLRTSHYENVGRIQANTSYGEIIADEYASEWHQKMLRRWIFMGGYRFYRELEDPRAEAANQKQNGVDQVYSSVRYRFSNNWAARTHEVSLAYGKYLNNRGLGGQYIGVGAELQF